MLKLTVGAVLLAGILPAVSSPLRAKIVEAGPGTLDKTRSLADLVGPGKTVHIVYVHGMRAEGEGASRPLKALLEGRLGFASGKPSEPQHVSLGPWPQTARYMTRPIWRSDADWQASRPFVIRYNLTRGDGAKVMIDEVNWWPLLFPLKCRFLIVPEHDLSGDDRAHLDLCGLDPVKAPYNWLGEEERRELRLKPRGGHAALINRGLKQQIMNWGLSDAVIAGGPLQDYLHTAMEQAFDFARKESSGADSYVVMSESLGSFVVLDAMRVAPSVREFVDRSDYLYFFANQFALLELGRLTGIPGYVAPGPGRAAFVDAATQSVVGTSPFARLCEWARAPGKLRDTPRQIISFSDPSDILTYRVPAMGRAIVVNIYVRNGTGILGIFADPVKAHTGHLRNRSVWEVLVRKAGSRKSSVRAQSSPDHGDGGSGAGCPGSMATGAR